MSASPSPNATPVLPKNKPGLRDSMQLFAREILAQLACAQSATVQAFYPTNQTADLAFNAELVVGYQTSASGQTTPITRSYPLLPAVPVIFLGGGGGAMTFPVAQGDSALLIFLDRDQDVWLTTGQTKLPPNSKRLHSLSDAVAIVGLRSAVGALKNFSTTDVEIYGTGGTAGALIALGQGANGKIGIGNGTGQLVTQLDAMATALDNLATALDNWVDTHGDTPTPATQTAINNAKAQWDAAKTNWDKILK